MKIEIPYTEQELNNEIWKNFRNTNYQVSDIGRVRNINSGIFLTLQKNEKGYVFFLYRHNKKNCNQKVHRAMYEAFNEDFDPTDENINVHHMDENIWNNRLWNLQEINRSIHFSFHKTKDKNPKYKGPMARFTLDGTFVGITYGKYELRDLGFCPRTPYLVANKQRKHHKEHIFRWHDERMILMKGVRYDVDNLPKKLQGGQGYLF
jgi:hypothetical protein